MRILRYKQLNENQNVNDTPENYIIDALQMIKTKVEKIFSSGAEVDNGKIKRFRGEDRGEQMSLGDLGMQLQSSELSKYSKTHKNVKFKFSDEEFLYDLMITIQLKNAIPKPDKEFSENDIKKCFFVFKKYTIDDFNIIGQIRDNVKIEDVNEDFLIKIKLDLDNKIGGDTDEFEIVTDEKEKGK